MELRDFENKTNRPDLLKASTSNNSDYKIEIALKDKDLLLKILPEKSGTEIKTTSFPLQVDNYELGDREGNPNFLGSPDKTLTVPLRLFSLSTLEKAETTGTIFGTTSKYSGHFLEGFSILSTLFDFDVSGTLLQLSFSLKIMVKFRFLKVSFGNLLGAFLGNTGDNLEPKGRLSRDSILMN